jgi:hypothetical protein
MVKMMHEGWSDYTIVIPGEAALPLRFAAQQLSTYLSKMTGITLPIMAENLSGSEHEICIGPVERPGCPDTAELIHDGYKIRTVGQRIFVVSHTHRGVVHAVYALLEEGFGCRFFASGVEHIPHRSSLCLPQMDLTRISPFEYRSCFWYGMMHDADFAAKRGQNGMHNELEVRHGGSIRYFPFVHSFVHHYVPLEKYGKEHPEYYSMIDGVRRLEPMGTQLCLTNPEVLELTIAQLRQDIKEHPEATIFSLSQNDCYYPCQCPECARVDAEEGSASGTMLRFVNACARAITKDYPHIVIDTLAYHYTRPAPRITRPEPNVTVRLCTIEGCFSHPMEECEVMTCQRYIDNNPPGASMGKDFEDWSRICNRLSIWDYETNFTYYLNPLANVPVLQRNIQYFIQHHATSLFEQGNGQSPSGELGELKAYLSAKLMWEPDGDVRLWTQEFMEGYYGRAAAPLTRYLQLFHEHVARANIHMGIRVPPDWGHMPPALLEKAEALFDQAELLAEDEAVLERVQRSRLSIRFVRIACMPLEDSRRKDLFESFKKDVTRLGVTYIRESVALEDALAMLEAGTF